MWDVSITAAGALILRTFPFMLLRAAVYFGIASAFVVAAGGGAGIGWGIGALAGTQSRVPGAFWGAVGGLALIGFMLWWLREYLLYLVEASHAAAMVLALDRTPQPLGQGRIPAAMTALQLRFREVGVLFSTERLVQGAIGRLIAALDTLASILPAGFLVPRNLSDAVLRNALGFVGKVLLARAVRGNVREPWPSLQDALVLLAQNHGILMRNAVFLAAGAFAASVALFFVALIPAAAMAQAYPGGSGLISILLALIFAWAVKQALIEPVVVAAFLDLYMRVAEGQAAEPDWDAKLVETSEQFREIKTRAAPPSRGTRRSLIV
jgi:hypothetical protein